MIEKIVPGTKLKMTVIKAIYENPGINVTSLIKKVRASPNSIINYLNELEFFGVIEKVTTGKKLAVRNIRFNLNSELCILILSLLEMDKKENLIKKYPKLKILFEQIPNVVKNGFVLVYGSYARFAAEKDSDIDIIIVGDRLNKERIKEVLITYPESSLKIETIKTFLSNLSKPLYKNILKDHIVVYNETAFLKTIKIFFE